MNTSNYTDGLNINVRNALGKALENNSIETYNTLREFIIRILTMSVENRAEKHFHEYIFLPGFCYQIAFEKYKIDQKSLRLKRICSENAVLELQGLISFSIGFYSKKVASLKEKEKLNTFYYLTYNALSSLLFSFVKYRDVQYYKFAMTQINMITEVNHVGYELESKMRDLKRQNTNRELDSEISALQKEIDILEKPEVYKRHCLMGIKYWTIYQFITGKINKSAALAIIEKTPSPNSNSNDLIKDIVFFYYSSRLGNYFEWQSWSFSEQEPGEMYVEELDWMLTGFLIDNMMNNRIFVNFEDLDSETISKMKGLYEALKLQLGYLKGHLKKISTLLNISDEEAFEAKGQQVLSAFAKAKKKAISDKDKVIVKTPISPEKVTSFREIVGKTWISNANVRWLFNQFNNWKLLDEDSKGRKMGNHWLLPKSFFIDTENYQPVYNIERIGGEIGRSEDDLFFSIINREPNYTKLEGSALELLDRALQIFKERGTQPTLILISPEYSYQDPEFLADSRFQGKLNGLPDMRSPAFYIGNFNSIPIYSSFSKYLNDKVVVSDFANAFEMGLEKDSTLYSEALHIQIEPINIEQAEQILKKEPDKWKQREEITLSDADAILLIQTNIRSLIYSELSFKVKDPTLYIIGQIVTQSRG